MLQWLYQPGGCSPPRRLPGWLRHNQDTKEKLMAIKLGAQPAFVKSTYSTGNGACVEVRSETAVSLDITDSKVTDSPTRPTLRVSPTAFQSLVAFARTA